MKCPSLYPAYALRTLTCAVLLLLLGVTLASAQEGQHRPVCEKV